MFAAKRAWGDTEIISDICGTIEINIKIPESSMRLKFMLRSRAISLLWALNLQAAVDFIDHIKFFTSSSVGPAAVNTPSLWA